MDFSILRHHEQALQMRALRNRVLSSNIANADTPNFKARDFEFKSALEQAKTEKVVMRRTNPKHQSTWSTALAQHDLKYRIPFQPSLDGNTVETDVEQAAFAENAVLYRASLRFLDGKIKSLRFAIKGGD